MSVVELGILDFVVFFVLVVVLPLEAFRRVRKLKADLEAGRNEARMREYRRTMLEEWLLTAAVGVGWFLAGRSAKSIGLVPELDLPALIGYAATVIAVVFLVIQSRIILGSAEKREEVRHQLASAAAIIPRTRGETQAFRFLSVTAGVCEEFLYRGFLLTYFWSLLPAQPVWLGILLGGAGFGFAHLYQGWTGVLKTGALGILMGGLYWLTGSIWAPILLHAAVDLNSGNLGFRVLSEVTGERRGNEGAA